MEKEIRYDNKDYFQRRYLYIHNELDKELAVKAAELGTDKSQVLNLALHLYFKKMKEEK